MLVGFPGETDADYEELKEFIEEMKFERLGVFPFSNEDGIYAHKHFKDDVLDEENRNAPMKLWKSSSTFWLNWTGKKWKTLKVIIDKKEGEFYIGCTEFDSPEVDG